MSEGITTSRTPASYRVRASTGPARELTVRDVLAFANELRELMRTDGLTDSHPVLGELSGFRLSQLRVSFDVEVPR